MGILTSDKSGQVQSRRDHVLTDKERHASVCENGLGYPCRAIRTTDYPFIRNYEPDRWPAGDPVDGATPYYPNRSYGGIDDSPTKTYMMEHRTEPGAETLFALAFEKRSAEELYDPRKDPGQLHNVANRPEYAEAKARLAAALKEELLATGDPRAQGAGDVFDRYPYYGGRRLKR